VRRYCGAGKALFKLGRLSEASPELARAAKLNPEGSKPHFLLARIYEQLGQHDRARNERKNVTRIQGRSGQAGMATVDPVPSRPNNSLLSPATFFDWDKKPINRR